MKVLRLASIRATLRKKLYKKSKAGQSIEKTTNNEDTNVAIYEGRDDDIEALIVAREAEPNLRDGADGRRDGVEDTRNTDMNIHEIKSTANAPVDRKRIKASMRGKVKKLMSPIFRVAGLRKRKVDAREESADEQAFAAMQEDLEEHRADIDALLGNFKPTRTNSCLDHEVKSSDGADEATSDQDGTKDELDVPEIELSLSATWASQLALFMGATQPETEQVTVNNYESVDCGIFEVRSEDVANGMTSDDKEGANADSTVADVEANQSRGKIQQSAPVPSIKATEVPSESAIDKSNTQPGILEVGSEDSDLAVGDMDSPNEEGAIDNGSAEADVEKVKSGADIDSSVPSSSWMTALVLYKGKTKTEEVSSVTAQEESAGIIPCENVEGVKEEGETIANGKASNDKEGDNADSTVADVEANQSGCKIQQSTPVPSIKATEVPSESAIDKSNTQPGILEVGSEDSDLALGDMDSPNEEGVIDNGSAEADVEKVNSGADIDRSLPSSSWMTALVLYKGKTKIEEVSSVTAQEESAGSVKEGEKITSSNIEKSNCEAELDNPQSGSSWSPFASCLGEETSDMTTETDETASSATSNDIDQAFCQMTTLFYSFSNKNNEATEVDSRKKASSPEILGSPEYGIPNQTTSIAEQSLLKTSDSNSSLMDQASVPSKSPSSCSKKIQVSTTPNPPTKPAADNLAFKSPSTSAKKTLATPSQRTTRSKPTQVNKKRLFTNRFKMELASKKLDRQRPSETVPVVKESKLKDSKIKSSVLVNIEHLFQPKEIPFERTISDTEVLVLKHDDEEICEAYELVKPSTWSGVEHRFQDSDDDEDDSDSVVTHISGLDQDGPFVGSSKCGLSAGVHDALIWWGELFFNCCPEHRDKQIVRDTARFGEEAVYVVRDLTKGKL